MLRIRSTILLVTLAALIAVPTRAQPKAGEPAVAAEVSIAGIDRGDAAMKKGGFDGYAALISPVMEGFPFIGKGAVDSTAPAGIHFLAGDQLPPQSLAFFLIPVKPGRGQLAPLAEQGFKAMPGHPDTVVAPNDFAIRRTAGYVIAGAAAAPVTAASEDALRAPFKDPAVLAQASISVSAFRTASPQKFAAFLDNIDRNNAAQGQAELLGGQLLTEPIRKSLDALVLTLRADGERLTMRTNVAPITLKPSAAKFPRPAFPDACFARADFVYPSADTGPLIGSAIAKVHALGGGSPQGQKRLEAALPDALKELVGDAISLGFEWADGALVTYAAIQFGEARDVAAGSKKLEAIVATDPTVAVVRSTYTDGDLAVTRLTFSDKGKPALLVDVVSADPKRATLAISSRDGKYVARTARLKPSGEIAGLLAGEVDLPAVRKIVATLPAGALDAQQKAMADEVLKGDKVTFTLAIDGKSATFDLVGPLSWLGHAMKMAPLQ